MLFVLILFYVGHYHCRLDEEPSCDQGLQCQPIRREEVIVCWSFLRASFFPLEFGNDFFLLYEHTRSWNMPSHFLLRSFYDNALPFLFCALATNFTLSTMVPKCFVLGFCIFF
jgi:hypothetical protein